MTFIIQLPVFEGPFDLLLFFIERDELDIYDIPIATITEEFLAYIKQAEKLNIDLASEFILVAATLMRIKSRMLIPRKVVDEAGNEVDPRQELVDRILEYKRYKSVLDELREFEENQALRQERGNTARELKELATRALVDVEMESVTLFKLLRTFELVMSKLEDPGKKTVHRVMRYEYSIHDQVTYVLNTLSSRSKSSFEDLFSICDNRIHAIVTFLALLELLNRQEVHITQGEGLNQFWVSLREEGDEEE